MWFNILGKVQANMGIGTIAQIYAKEVISEFQETREQHLQCAKQLATHRAFAKVTYKCNYLNANVENICNRTKDIPKDMYM